MGLEKCLPLQIMSIPRKMCLFHDILRRLARLLFCWIACRGDTTVVLRFVEWLSVAGNCVYYFRS